MADNLLSQANIYREEKVVVDLCIILLRYSSLVLETIPYHRYHQASCPKERASYRKKLRDVVNELEYWKPEFQRQVDELNKAHVGAQLVGLDALEATRYDSNASSIDQPSVPSSSHTIMGSEKSGNRTPQPSLKYNSKQTQVLSSNAIQLGKQIPNLSFGLPLPKKETLSRRSILGLDGLQGQWSQRSAEMKVQNTNTTDLAATDNLR